MDEIFSVSFFFLFGLVIPFDEWKSAGWGGALVVITCLSLRRLEFVLLCKPLIPDLNTWKDAWMVGKMDLHVKKLHLYNFPFFLQGWFGPVGVGALFYQIISITMVGDSVYFVWPLGSVPL